MATSVPECAHQTPNRVSASFFVTESERVLNLEVQPPGLGRRSFSFLVDTVAQRHADRVKRPRGFRNAQQRLWTCADITASARARVPGNGRSNGTKR